MKGVEMSIESVIDIPGYIAGKWTTTPDHIGLESRFHCCTWRRSSVHWPRDLQPERHPRPASINRTMFSKTLLSGDTGGYERR
jgi:hypothetical protein